MAYAFIEAILEKSGIISFITFLACLCGSIEIMDFFLKEKDPIGCILSKLVDLNLFKNNGVFLLVSEWPKYLKNSDLRN